MTRPALLLDVDGPLNPFAAKPHRRPAGYLTLRVPVTDHDEPGREEASDGIGSARSKPLRVWLNPAHGPALLSLDVDLVWATTWEEQANTHIAPVLGLPTLPVIAWHRPESERSDGVFWKTPQIIEWAAGRPFAWVDDQITEADCDLVRQQHGGEALLIRVDPRTGLLQQDFDRISQWTAAGR